MRFLFVFVLPRGHEKKITLTGLCVFAFKLLITCLLSFVPLGGNMYAIIIPFFYVHVSHRASIKQSRKKGARCYLCVKTKRKKNMKLN